MASVCACVYVCFMGTGAYGVLVYSIVIGETASTRVEINRRGFTKIGS